MKAEKCKFFQRRVKYLGHVISNEGLQVDTDKTDTLKFRHESQNINDLLTFLGFTGYFRKFVKDYAKIAKP